MASTVNLRSRRSAAQLHALAGVEREIRAQDSHSRRKYVREFSQAFRTYDSLLNSQEIHTALHAADVVLVGDYHALPAAQRYAASLIEQRALAGDRPVVLGVETIFARDQHILDEWWRREIDESELRRAVLANMADEKGMDDTFGDRSAPHSELWLDFAEGMGASREMGGHEPVPEVKELTTFFHRVASEGTPEEALAAFYAYESQVPRVAKEKARGLREMYGANEHVTAYFSLHTTADVYHSQIWRQQLGKQLQENPSAAERALEAAENAAKALWHALDGIDARRMAKAA